MTPSTRARPTSVGFRSRLVRLAVAGGLGGLILAGPAPVAGATTLVVSTPYPAVAVEPGATASFDVTVTTDTRERVDLSIDGLPDGWKATLRGGGFVVDGVFTDPADPPKVTLDVEVPAAADQGTYRISVIGRATGITDSLVLDLRVAEAAGGEMTLNSDFPQLQGPSDATFNFNLTLNNDTPEEVSANLTTEGAPEGWQVTARPSGEEQAATAKVDAGGSTGITVQVDPPNDVAAGDYPITVRAAGGGRTAEAKLQVTITGNYAMTLTTPDERLNATVQAGSPRDIQLVVVNDGTAPLVNVQLSGTPPSGWEVTFQPQTIDQVAPGESSQVTATIQPTAEAVAGDYVVSFSASTAETSANVDIRTTVETSLTWAVVGALLIIGTLLALGWVFQRYGRR
jgi:uncharacterized membrane protein